MTISNILFFLISTADVQLVTMIAGMLALVAIAIIAYRILNRLNDYFNTMPIGGNDVLKVGFDRQFSENQNNHTKDFFAIRFWLEKDGGDIVPNVRGKFIPNGNDRDLIGLLLFENDDTNSSGISVDKVNIFREYGPIDDSIPKKLNSTNPEYYFNVQGNIGQNTTDPETPVTHQEPRKP